MKKIIITLPDISMHTLDLIHESTLDWLNAPGSAALCLPMGSTVECIPTRDACRALAEQHEYWSTYHAFSTNVIERAQRVKQNAQRLNDQIEQCAV